VGLDPDCAPAWTALAQAVRQLGQNDEAETYAGAALALAHAPPDAALIVGNALLEAGHPAAARARFGGVMATLSWARATALALKAPGDRPRVGVIAAPGRANTPFDFILDRRHLAIEVVLMLEDVAYPYARIAASYDVLFNAASDPDRDASAVARARTFAARV